MPTIRRATAEDHDRVFDLARQAFNVPSSARERARATFKPSLTRLVEDGGTVVATMRELPFAHVWGGRSVKAAGVAGVAVPAEHRGKGYATMVMNEALRDLRAEGTLISSLYPATAPIYRACGYGFGGVRSVWKADLDALPARADLTVEQLDDDALDEVMACYGAVAAISNGLLDRDRDWWNERVLHSKWEEDSPYAYVVREDGRVTGFVIYQLERQQDDWRSMILCRDLTWTTREAARALLALLAMHRSTSSKMKWIGPPTEPLADLLPEDRFDIHFRFRWMLRLLDVPGAIEARGYPRHVDAAVTIGVRDPLFPENQGPWRVEVSEGRAKVAPADAAEATADVQTWASIWSGLHTAADEVRLGNLDATEDAVAALGSIFAGPLPWLADFF